MDFHSEFDPSSSSRRLKHPSVTFFHLLFRSLALFLYLFGGWFSKSFIGIFVSVVLLLSLDFWTVKNVTGRIMVGLRWWNYIDAEGNSQWMFEARNGDTQHLLSPSEVSIFWTSLVLAPALWAVFFVTALMGLKFQWLILVIIGLTLTASNLLGYMRCRMGRSESLYASASNMANSYMQKQMMSNVMNMFTRQGGAPQANMGGQPANVI